jgi:exodeoxyribonuclease VII small subunit
VPANDKDQAFIPQVGFEASLEELEKIVQQMEAGELPLEKSLELFERGVGLSETCRKQLDEAETRIEVLLKKGKKLEPSAMPEQA